MEVTGVLEGEKMTKRQVEVPAFRFCGVVITGPEFPALCTLHSHLHHCNLWVQLLPEQDSPFTAQ